MPAFKNTIIYCYPVYSINLTIPVQTISSASTKEVNTKGNNKVSQGQWVATAKMVSATKKKKINQYSPFDLFFISMLKKFWQK